MNMQTMPEISTEEGQFRVLSILYLVFLSDRNYRFSQLYHLNPLTEKLDACTNLLRKINLSGDIWRLQHSTQVHLQYIGRITQVVSFLLKQKIVTPRVKHIDIPVCFLQEQFYNGLFLPKYEKSSFMPAYMCTKQCSGPIISRSTKSMTGFIFYPTSETEHYQFMILH